MLFVDVCRRLLATTTKDGNDGLFYGACSIVDDETNNWTWFMEMLNAMLHGGYANYEKTITPVFNRLQGLINTIVIIFPAFPEAYCLRHVDANFQSIGNYVQNKKGRLCVVGKENLIHTCEIRV